MYLHTGTSKENECLSDAKMILYYTVTLSSNSEQLLGSVGHFGAQQPGSPAPTDVALQEHKLQAISNETLPEELHHWSSRSNFLVSNAEVEWHWA